MTIRVSGHILLLAVCAACSDGDNRLHTSTGVALGSVSATGEISIDTAPVALIATVSQPDAPDDLSSLTDAAYQAANIVVLDDKENRIHVFDARGRHTQSFGRSGEGPGEFRAPLAVKSCGHGDRISVWDAGTNTFIRFSPDGKEVQREPLPAGVGRLACNGDRIGVGIITGRISRPTEENFLMPGKVLLLSPGRDSMQSPTFTDVVLAENRPLGALSALLMNETHLIFASGKGDTLLLVRHSDGAQSIVRVGVTAGAPTQQEYDAAIEHTAKRMDTEEDQEMVRETLRRIPMPDALPAFRSATLQGERELWLTLTPLGTPETSVAVVDLYSGQTLARVTLPADADILDVRADRLLVRYPVVETGGATIASYRLHRQTTENQ